MKKNHLKIIPAAFLIGTALIMNSCNKDDDEIATTAVVGIAQDPSKL
ncbi:hypothetical protein QE422_001530 [Chryseobacterium sp. SORGH_AS 447]|nr:hypothetical protein [Chryseobacterium sp. SORGH_AS_0447]MDQ1161162.1 hypothetical protein [Chryseobacterium sp. SORGH_AS_0447]